MKPVSCLLAAISLLLGLGLHAEPLTLIFAGDIMLDDGPGRLIAQGGDPLASFADILQAADYRIGNLECPIADVGRAADNKIYSFRASPAATRVLAGRFDAVGLANNHSGDYGQAAFLETISHLDSAGITHFGGGRNLGEAHQPLWITRNGLKVAVLAYNEFKPRAFEAGADWPGIAWSEDDQVIDDIRAARAAGADLVIPFMHWGWEKETLPGERQRQFARRLIDEGAALVVGGHPHVTQGAEIYQGKPIIYSLGNFVFDGFDYPEARRGWLLRVRLDRSGVVDWATVAAQIDADGTPHPVADALRARRRRPGRRLPQSLNGGPAGASGAAAAAPTLRRTRGTVVAPQQQCLEQLPGHRVSFPSSRQNARFADSRLHPSNGGSGAMPPGSKRLAPLALQGKSCIHGKLCRRSPSPPSGWFLVTSGPVRSMP
ncbi:MAG: CapA family protein [Bacteroidota bacterium]